jgi:hypothetical protein
MAEAKKMLRVVGAAVVLGTAGGSERYLYEGAVVPAEGFRPKSVKRAIDNGLVVEFEDAPAAGESESAAETEPYEGQSVTDLKKVIDERNANREDADKIAPSDGKRPALVAALVADDEKLAAAAASS